MSTVDRNRTAGGCEPYGAVAIVARMANNDDLAGDRMIVPADRVIEKRTMCANCLHFDAGSHVLLAWRSDPNTVAKIEHVMSQVRFTGIKFSGFDGGRDALYLDNLVRSGLSREDALVTLERAKLEAAQRKMGPMVDPAWADYRLKDYYETMRALAEGKLGVCKGGGIAGEPNELGEEYELLPLQPVFSAYHCRKWSGREGWTVAHGPDRTLDPLPAELQEMADAKANKAE